MSKVALCTTAREGGTSLHLYVPTAIIAVDTLRKLGHVVKFVEAEGGELGGSRAEVVARARAAKADWLLLLDADMSVRPEVFSAMFAVERPVVLTPYPRRHGETLFDAEWAPEGPLRIHHRSGHRTVEVRGGGLGCCLIHADIVEALYDICQPFACGKELELEAAGLFDNIYEERTTEHGTKWHRMGEDWSFFRRVESLDVAREALCDMSPGIIHAGVCADYAPALKRECERRGCAGCGA